MKRIDQIKLNFTRGWDLPGKERLSGFFKLSDEVKAKLKGGIIWLKHEDIALYTTVDNYIECTILGTGTYEDDIKKLINISLKDGENALDIGGNIGLQSIRMSKCVGSNGKIYAFEPLTYLQEKFKKNVQLNRVDNVVLIPYALSNEEGDLEFTININSYNQGTFSLTHNSNGAEKQVVNIKIADNLPEIQNLNTLSLIKIDVEGFEFQIIKGLEKTIQKHRPRIIFEYDENYWKNSGQKIEDCYSFFSSLNYTIYQITPFGCELVVNPFEIIGGNLFCMPN
jgi:FkbM family methyltransferase